MSWLEQIASQGTAFLLGGVSGGFLGAVAIAATWWWDSRRRTTMELLRDGFAIHASMEAWILESSHDGCLSMARSTAPTPRGEGLSLKNVEVRLILDQSPWNAPTKNFFDIIDGKRVWIVRDKIIDGDSYPRTADVKDLRPYPALLSSRGIHELSGWIERVSSLCFWRVWPFPRRKKPIAFFLSRHDISALWPLLAPVRDDDRINLLQSRLSQDATAFLRWYRVKFAIRE